MNRPIYIALVLLVGVAVAPSDAFARGFGGFHGGGIGGFHAGGFGGGFHAGGFGGAAAGLHARGFGGAAGGFHAGGAAGGFRAGGSRGEAGGFRAGGLGGAAGAFHAGGGSLSRGQLSSFLGLPTDGGMHAAGGAVAGRGAAAGPGGAAAWRGGATAHAYQGPAGTTVYHGTAGARGAAVGPGGAAAGGRYASGTAVQGPRGNTYTHTTSGGRGVAAGPGGVAAGRQFSSRSTLHGAGGTTVSRGVSGAQGVAAGRYGVAAGGRAVAGGGYRTAYGTHAWSPTYFHAQAVAGQRWFAANPVFTAGWAGAHPRAWHPAAYAPAAWARAVWAPVAWSAVGAWIGCDATPTYYNYGDNITVQGDNVYYGSQPAGTTDQYYQEAASLAGTGAGAEVSKDAKWMALGVFGLMAAGQTTPEMVFQLAVDKQGVIRGNYYDQVSQSALPVEGSVNKKNQRVAWRVGNNKNLVVETGLYNLTEDQSTALVHYGPDKTQQYVMVRMKQPPGGKEGQK